MLAVASLTAAIFAIAFPVPDGRQTKSIFFFTDRFTNTIKNKRVSNKQSVGKRNNPNMETDLAARAIELAKVALLNYLNAQWGIEEAPNLDSARILYTPELEGSPLLDQAVTEWYEANAETVFDEWCSTRKHGNGRGQCGCKRRELIVL